MWIVLAFSSGGRRVDIELAGCQRIMNSCTCTLAANSLHFSADGLLHAAPAEGQRVVVVDIFGDHGVVVELAEGQRVAVDLAKDRRVVLELAGGQRFVFVNLSGDQRVIVELLRSQRVVVELI